MIVAEVVLNTLIIPYMSGVKTRVVIMAVNRLIKKLIQVDIENLKMDFNILSVFLTITFSDNVLYSSYWESKMYHAIH